MKPKLKKCRICRGPFAPLSSLHVVCSAPCAIENTRRLQIEREAKLKRDDAKRHRERKEAIKTLADYKREAQQAFNEWVRLRDHHLPCVSCGRHHQGQYHAGHYRTVGSNPELRYEPLNCHKQCAPCNNHKSGDIVNYRLELVRRIGADKVAWLEGRHDAKKYTIDDLKQIAKEYRAKARELRRKLDK